ncbi:swi/snf-related matrix-associated actin-dependent regulator of chromatin subfamily a-like protein 1 [Plakobranchus ocellatus]|uniref:Swi/snf-related matrix-associated actin-dependent regulator of chromatin subfamily a-like protein 1 n=1 Tax=Plakobranchus ocellatus TaxID=259542 RepID=A0AAV4BED3_9GAST|nr:swi/snf-related matrix-associated actin-dependent regulator of chromatin subfamily a-like protein 1 [Plakobranchus ocellatus]
MSSAGLTEEQRRKIEENKQRALAKRAEKSLSYKNGSTNLLPSTAFTAKSTTDKTVIENRLKALEKKHNIGHPSVQNQNQVFTNHERQIVRHAQPFSQFPTKSNTASRTQQAKPSHKISSQSASLVPSKKFFPEKIQCLKGRCVLISQDTFSVDVGYHCAVIEFFKQQKTRSYDATKKIWSFKLEEYDVIMKGLSSFRPDVEIEGLPRHILEIFGQQQQENVQVPQADLRSVSADLVNTLKEFQREGVNIAIHRKGRLLLADDMGLGKTLQAICVAAYYREEWPLLVVAPSSVRFDWAQQICKWLPDVPQCDVNVVESSKASATCGLVNILSYDLLSKKAQELKKQQFKIIIMDESHFLKNYKTVRTKAAMPLLMSAKRVLLLSGTPALSRPNELFCQIVAVCPHMFKFHDFGLRYCDAKQLPWGWDYSGSSNMLELQLLLEKRVMVRRQKKDVLSQLPAKTRQMVVLDPQSVQHHKNLKAASKIMDKVKLKGLERRGALLQYFQETSRAKLSAVREYILDLLESDKKFLIFAHHREMLNAIEDCIQSQQSRKIDYIRIDGSTTSEQRNYFCRKFQTREDCKLAILSITAANAGLNLSAANIVVFAELFWNPGILVQAEDRAHRIGQKDSVSVQYLVAQGTADDYIWPLVQGKLDVLGKAGLTKDNFSNADTKIMTDPSQTTIMALFKSDFIEITGPVEIASDNQPGVSGSGVFKVSCNSGEENNKSIKASPGKRQASITNFIQTTPSKKMRVEQNTPSEFEAVDEAWFEEETEANDGSEVTLTNDDLAAMESFDWDDQM